jgi:thioredoxin reductase
LPCQIIKEPMDTNLYDLIIVGAGPAGLTAAIFAVKKRLSLLLLEGSKAGGQLTSLYPHKPVYNYPGYSEIEAAGLAQKMQEQAEREGITLLEETPVKAITAAGDGNYKFQVPGRRYRAQSVILACGMGLFEPQRLRVPGESELAGSAIFYTVGDIAAWRNQSVAVIGGGNSALDNSLFLHGQASKVTIVHQLKQFQAEAASVEQARESCLQVLLGWKVERFAKENNHITLYLKNTDGQQQERIAADRVLINIGLKTSYAFLDTLPLARDKKRIIVDSEMKTSLPGIFACGDAVSYSGKVRLIVTAIGEAATAVNSVEEFLKKKKTSEVQHED